jgi:hypothetical protein
LEIEREGEKVPHFLTLTIPGLESSGKFYKEYLQTSTEKGTLKSFSSVSSILVSLLFYSLISSLPFLLSFDGKNPSFICWAGIEFIHRERTEKGWRWTYYVLRNLPSPSLSPSVPLSVSLTVCIWIAS